jgi:hypothetical protein
MTQTKRGGGEERGGGGGEAEEMDMEETEEGPWG